MTSPTAHAASESIHNRSFNYRTNNLTACKTPFEKKHREMTADDFSKLTLEFMAKQIN